MQLTGRRMYEINFKGDESTVQSDLKLMLQAEAEDRKKSGLAGEKVDVSQMPKTLDADDVDWIQGQFDQSWIVREVVDTLGIDFKGNVEDYSELCMEAITGFFRSIERFVSKKSYKNIDDPKDKQEMRIRMSTGDDFERIMDEITENDVDPGIGFMRSIEKKAKEQNITISPKFREELCRHFVDEFKKVVKSQKRMMAQENQTEEGFGNALAGSKPDTVYNRLTKVLGQGRTVVARTQGDHWFGKLEDRQKMGKGKNKERTFEGLASGHAYTVMGVRPRGNRRYVLLRNPWGEGTREYVINPEKTVGFKEFKSMQSCGIFLREINDFVANFSQIVYV